MDPGTRGFGPVSAGIVVLLLLLAWVAIWVARRGRRLRGAGWRCRSWRPVVLALGGGAGIALVLFTAKALVGRTRPPLPFAVIEAHGYSFPSGHATGTAAMMILCAWMLTRWLVPWWTGRVMVWFVGAGSVFVIGFSRVYLGVHYLSDVLAGWLLGMTWAGIVMLVGSWWDNTGSAGGRPDFR